MSGSKRRYKRKYRKAEQPPEKGPIDPLTVFHPDTPAYALRMGRPQIIFREDPLVTAAIKKAGPYPKNPLQAFQQEYADVLSDLPTLVNGENFFFINFSDKLTMLSRVKEIASSKTDSVICVHDLKSVVGSQELVPLLQKSKISVFEINAEDDTSRVLFAFRQGLEQSSAYQTVSDLNQKSAKSRRAKADAYALELKETIEEIEASGKKSLWAVADELTSKNILAPSGKPKWSDVAVMRIKKRLKELNQRG